MNDTQLAKIDGRGNIVVQNLGDGNTVQIDRPRLTIIPPRNRRPECRNEIDLLNPYARAFDLVGRESDMDELWQWLHADRPVSIRTMTGRAGAGKTRIAVELIERLGDQCPGQWDAGFVQGSELHRFATQQNLADWGWSRPTFVVIDYAASLITPLGEWLRDLSQNANGSARLPLRILLLEREASHEQGWLQSLLLGGYSEARLPDLFDPLEPKRLDRLESTGDRRVVLDRMLASAAGLAERDPPRVPAPGEDARLDRLLDNSIWEDPLYLMMAALLSLRSDLVAVLELPRTEVALQLADHEIKRLREGIPEESNQRLSVHLAALASMGGGVSREQALALAEQECRVLGFACSQGPASLLDRLHSILPAPDFGIAPVVPDILAEALVVRALETCSSAQQADAISRLVGMLNRRRVVPFIIRTVQDFANESRSAPLLWLERLIADGMADDPGLLAEIEGALPQQTLALREKCVEVGLALVERLEELEESDPGEAVVVERARILNNLAARLSALGRREEALEQAREAVRIREQLARARPDAFLPYLAGSLNNLANMLSALGRREEALEQARESVRIYEQLARARPDAFLPDLAMSLNNLANMLSALGRREEALEQARESVRIYEQLARARPDAFLPDLAMSLNNLANMLSALGRREEALEQARESVRIREQLARARPDAFLPDLAMSLNNLANRLSALGRREEALEQSRESVRIYEQLARARPDAFLPYLAGSLNNLATMLSDLGRREEALEQSRESVRIYEQLARARPDAFLPDLAMSLNNLANRLSALGRREEALEQSRESVRIREQLARARPDAFLPNLAASLNNLANMLSDLGRREEALEQARESVRIYEQLAQARPDAFLPDLAISCGALGAVLRGLDRDDEAAKSFAKGIRALSPLFLKIPEAFAPLIGNLMFEYRSAIQESGSQPDMELLAPILKILEQMNMGNDQKE